MEIDDIDLSYSGLVDKIQSDKKIASEYLEVICKDIVARSARIVKLEAEIKAEKNNLAYSKGGIDKISKHMGLKPTFNFVFGTTIYAFNQDGDFTTFDITNKDLLSL